MTNGIFYEDVRTFKYALEKGTKCIFYREIPQIPRPKSLEQLPILKNSSTMSLSRVTQLIFQLVFIARLHRDLGLFDDRLAFENISLRF